MKQKNKVIYLMNWKRIMRPIRTTPPTTDATTIVVVLSA